MVINGASRRSVGFWAKHLANDKKNDRAELKEIRGLGATNLKDALLEMQEDARRTRCKNFFYQANFNPCADEHLTEEQWQRAFEIFEKHRGIPAGQARVVYEHEKDGRTHRHVVWSRIDLETMKAWPDRLDARVCHAASREISEELGLERTISPFDRDRESPRPERAPKPYEMFRGLRSGLDPREIKAEVSAIFRNSENAADFVAGLEQHGYQLIRGDKRDFCILDNAGDVHSLARRLDGVNTKQLRTFMEEIDRSVLPTAEQARVRLQERQLEERKADLATVQAEIAWEEALRKAAIEKEKVEQRYVEPASRGVRDQARRGGARPGNTLPGDPTLSPASPHARAQQGVIELQSLHDTLRDVKAAERGEKVEAGRTKSPQFRGREGLLPTAQRAASGGTAAVGGAFHAAAKIAEGVLGLFDPPLTPAQKLEARIEQAKRDAEAYQNSDISTLAQLTIQQERERQRREKDRGRER
jgi:hypothetical protein